MEPFGSSLDTSVFSARRLYHGHFDIFNIFGRNVLGEEFKGRHITRSNTTNLAGTKPSLGTFESFRLESRNIRDIYASVSSSYTRKTQRKGDKYSP